MMKRFEESGCVVDSSNKDFIRKVVKTAKKRALACIEAEGQHFEHKL